MTEVDVLQLVTIAFLVVIAIAWYLSYAASRLDRLHAKVEGSLHALDAQLVRRAETSLEIAMSGDLEPSSALLVADAATAALERHTVSTLHDDPLDGASFEGRELAESDLTMALRAALPDEVVAEIADDQEPTAEMLDRLAATTLRVQLARQFHNQAVREVRRVRAKPVVRVFRLAGHAALPESVIFDDEVPSLAGRTS